MPTSAPASSTPMYQDTFPVARKLRALTVPLWAGASVVEVGCNVGALGDYVLARGARGYAGSDLIAEYVAEGRRRHPHLALTVGSTDEADLGSADVLVALGVFHHMRDPSVRALLARAGAARIESVLIEMPMGTAPFKNYVIRPRVWYREALAASGFGHVEEIPYGFSYPIDRRILLARRVAPPPDAPQNDLRNHPEYWKRLGALPAALEALVHRGDYAPYARYWTARARRDGADPEGHRPYLLQMVAAIRDGSYRPPPILVGRGAAGLLWPRDGSHRASILRALGRPVPYRAG